MKRITIFILSLLVIFPVMAEKRYVSDVLIINLRTGPGNDFRILKGLKSGTHLEFLEEDTDNKFTKVKTDKGLEGWVPTRFMLKEPISFEKLILAQRELDKTRSDLTELKAKHSEAKKQLASTSRSSKNISKDLQKQTKELAHIKKVSANAINLDSKNNELMEQTEQLKITVDTLKADNERLQSSKDLNYILLGGLLILLGLFLGWLLPKISGKRGDAWA